MDAKTISAGIAVVVAAVVGGIAGGKITQKPTTELSVVAGATVVDEAVTAIAKTKTTVDDSYCVLERVGTKDGIELLWSCNGAVMGPKVQAELSKLAGPDATAITLTPKLDGEKVVFDSLVQTGGVKPSTDPIPKQAVAVLEAPKTEPPAEEIVEKVP